MKIRNGFVSNSSSSSFIIHDVKYLSKLSLDGYVCVELNKEQILKISEIIKDVLATDKKLYLTEYISDSDDLHYKLRNNCITYDEGNHGTPYTPESFDVIEISNGKVYIRKIHN